MKLEEIANNIVLDESGIYFSKSESEISYPEEGNEECMQLEESSFWFKHRNNIIAHKVKVDNREKTFFDIGGGNGFVAKRLQEESVEVVLVEPGKEGASNAKKRGVNSVVCSTLEDAGFKEEVMDAVGLFDVVEHIKDDVAFMKSINRYLKRGGRVYITVPAYKMLWSKEDDDAGHFTRYTLKTMNQLLIQSGFKIEYSTYFFSILPFPIFMFRTIPSLLGLNKKSNDLAKHKDEHAEREGATSSFLDKVWRWELSKIAQKRRIAFGGSCFIVASKQ